ncbi:hypothetical protein ACFW16_02720 [Inquilinus sp. NPDC058860]|uniref:hypothetical protein n=1 Tax=Inquilinus sp. NPDC058860 TaxID=3346652 RepID=UPI0036CD55B4
MRSILAIFAALLAGACVPQQGPKGFVVVKTANERTTAGAQATADRYCARAGRTALASDRQWNYIGFQCVMPANTLLAQTPIPPR